MIWALLGAAIASEVTATLALRASEGFRIRRWIPVTVACYLLSFVLLGAVLAGGMRVAIAYAIWAALGVAATAVFGRVIFKDAISPVTAAGLAVIVLGVIVVDLSSP